MQGHHDLGDYDDTDDDVAECNDDEDAWHHRHRGVVWGLLPERRPSKYIPFNYVHHLMFWCLAWLDGPSGQRKGHNISSPRAVPRDWWTIYWHACGGCRTQPITWCQIPRTTAGLSLTPSPFAKAGRLYMGPWGLWGRRCCCLAQIRPCCVWAGAWCLTGNRPLSIFMMTLCLPTKLAMCLALKGCVWHERHMGAHTSRLHDEGLQGLLCIYIGDAAVLH